LLDDAISWKNGRDVVSCADVPSGVTPTIGHAEVQDSGAT
jgi:hypothetical protein